MSKKVEDELEDYVWGRVKQKDYFQKVSQVDNREIDSILKRVSQIDDTLNRQLRKGVEENLSRLLEQTTALEALDKTQRGVHDEMKDVFQTCDRFANDLDSLLMQYKEQTQKMEHLIKVKNFLSDALRCEDLMDSLDKRSELVKRSEIVCEIRGTVQDCPELSQLVWLKDTVGSTLKAAENEVRKAAADDLKRGLVSLNASLVGSAVKALVNLGVLDAELEIQLASSAAEVDGKLAELSSSSDATRLLPICVNTIHSHLEQCTLLGQSYLSKFSEKLARSIRARIHLDSSFKLRFVQQMGRLLNSRPEYSLGPLDDALRPLKTSILSQSLQRLNSLIEAHDFSAGQANAFVDLLSSTFEEELAKVEFDSDLKDEMQKNIKKTIEIFARKLEMETKLETENLLFGDRLTASQLTNYKLLQTANALALRWPIHAAPLTAYQEEVLSSIFGSMKTSITTILSTMHKEELGNKEVSPYMMELCDFIGRILLHCSHMSAAAQHSVALHNMADFILESFVLYATLIRPLTETIRNQLHADFQRLFVVLSDIGFGGRFMDPKELATLFTATLPDISLQVPNWAIVHVLICSSPATLVSPAQSVDWTVDEYVAWCEKHNDLERMTFLNTLLSSYSSSVVARGEQQYVPFYPLLSRIVNQSMQAY